MNKFMIIQISKLSGLRVAVESDIPFLWDALDSKQEWIALKGDNFSFEVWEQGTGRQIEYD